MHLRNLYVALCFSCCLLFSKFSYSQKPEDIIGDWKVVKVELLPSADQEEKQNIGILRKTLLKSTFHFKSNNLFSFDCPDKELAIKTAFWTFDSTSQKIKVIERISKGHASFLMEITVKVLNGNYLFLMDESPVMLTVERE